MGPPPSAVQCGKTHIGGAKIIQSGTRHRSVSAVRRGVAFLWNSGKNRLHRRSRCRLLPRKSTPVVPDRTMIDWDDVRYFLAIARGGSVRAAAEQLGVNHSTVIRRMAQLEE